VLIDDRQMLQNAGTSILGTALTANVRRVTV
jgi:hypothetical protein